MVEKERQEKAKGKDVKRANASAKEQLKGREKRKEKKHEEGEKNNLIIL